MARGETRRTLSRNEAKIVLELEWRGQKTVAASELRSLISASEGYARFVAHRLVQKGWLQRIRRGLFQLVPADRGLDGVGDTNPLALGALLVHPYFFSFGTACTYHGFTEQVFAEVYIASRTNKRAVTIGSTRYVFVSLPQRRFFGFEEVVVLGATVRMATKERAILDALARPRDSGGMREVSRIVTKAAYQLSWVKLLALARQWDESAVVQRLGYLVDLHQIELPPKIRGGLQKLVIPTNKVHFGSRAEWGTSGRLVPAWGIIENIPRAQLIEKNRRERRRERTAHKRPA